MLHAPVTSFYAALLSILFIALSARVIARRRSGRIPIGVSGAPDLERAARVHANFAEYTPIALLLLLLVEQSGFSPWVLHLLGIALLAGRASHAFGVSRSPEDVRFRVSGMALTLATLGTASVLLLVTSVFRITV